MCVTMFNGIHHLAAFGQQIAVILTIVIMIIAVEKSTGSDNTDFVSTGKFLMFHNKSRPVDVSDCWTLVARTSKHFCLHFCAQNISCAAVFIEYRGNSNNSRVFDCFLCREVWIVSTLSSGNDQYAISKFGARGVPVPALPGATLDRVELYMGKMAAFYNCPPGYKATKFELAFDDRSQDWPPLSPACQNGLCSMESVHGVMMSGSEPTPGVYRLHPICKDHERARGHLECSAGSWSEFDDLGRICVPQNCQSRSSRGRNVYQGDLDHTHSGRTCQKWSDQSPHIHLYTLIDFLEDFNSVSDASNHCRDPGNDGYVWCFTTDFWTRWERCTVPSCP